jgi:hypothetical protein
MSHDDTLDVDPRTPAELESLLGEVLAAAVTNGVDPRGSWVYRNLDGVPDWELMVNELSDDVAAED